MAKVNPDCEVDLDADRDGVPAPLDCDDADESLAALVYPDTDKDGFGDPSGGGSCAPQAEGTTRRTGDCDDSDDSIYPGAPDTEGDDIDRDCGGADSQQPVICSGPGCPSSGLCADAALLEISEQAATAAESLTLWVFPGTWLMSQGVQLATPIQLRGIEDATRTMLVGDAQPMDKPVLSAYFSEVAAEDPTLEVSDLRFENFRFQPGVAGGVFTILSGSLDLQRVHISHAAFEVEGLDELEPTIASGAGVYANGARVKVTESLMEHLSAANGGAMSLAYSSLEVSQATFSCNSAAGGYLGGGAISAIDRHEATPQRELLMQDVLFVSNSSSNDGGAILTWPASPRDPGEVSISLGIDRARFIDNAAPSINSGRGGALAVGMRAQIHICEAEFEGNIAGDDGGALFVMATKLTMRGGSLRANSAKEGGAGFFKSDTIGEVEFPSQVSISGTSISFNTASSSGAGLYVDASSLTLRRSPIYLNVAGDSQSQVPSEVGSGGGIALSSSQLWMEDSVVMYNSAGLGGGIVGYQVPHDDEVEERIDLRRVALFRNDADSAIANPSGICIGCGGDLQVVGGVVSFQGAALVQSEAEAQGASLWVTAAESVELTQLLALTGRVASGGGPEPDRGMIFLDTGGPVMIERSALALNEGLELAFGDEGDDPVDASGVWLWDDEENQNRQLTNATASLTNTLHLGEDGGLADVVASYDSLAQYDLHLLLTSPMIDIGPEGCLDPDGSPCDGGIYGGPDGWRWDRDRDGFPDYFWPGGLEDMPLEWQPGAAVPEVMRALACWDPDDDDPAVVPAPAPCFDLTSLYEEQDPARHLHRSSR